MSKIVRRASAPTQQVVGENWSQYLHRRVMRLLLRHNQGLLRGQFRAFFASSELPQIPLLQFYDRYLKLVMFSDELLTHIMPNIRIQLSLRTELTLQQEEAPTRGEIDWPRTITEAINATPDQAPLQFTTRQRQQDNASPENLLVVAMLLNYQQTLRETLRVDMQGEALDEQERQALISIETSIVRELNVPYARALAEEASSADIDGLIEQVELQLKPGASPYRDLLTWWENLRDLHIGRIPAQRHLTLTHTRKHEQVDSWLYELWIALEMLAMLDESQMLVAESVEIGSDRLQCLFTWQERRFRFRYQRQGSVPAEPAPGWQEASAPQPGYIIEREQPSSVTVKGQVIWREAPVMLAANYSAAGNKAASTQEKIQQLLGAMRLAGAHHGEICTPILPDPPAANMWSCVIQSDQQAYTARVDSATSIYLYALPPDLDHATLHQRLRSLLDHAVVALPERPAPACYGILLDKDTVNASREHLHNGNVLCPKPHIGPDVFDLVDDRRHCLKDPRLCHVYGQAITPPFVIRVEMLSGLEQQSGDLRARNEDRLREAENAGDEARTEQIRGHIFLGVGGTIERYVQTRGNTILVEDHLKERFFGEYWDQHARCLAPETRNMLLSGEYVWGEYRQNTFQDWAAPAVQYCRALEAEIKRRFYNHYPAPKYDPKLGYAPAPAPGQKCFQVPNNDMTLGAVEHIYKAKGHQDQARNNWKLFVEIVTRSQSDAVSVTKMLAQLDAFLQRMTYIRIKDKRNKLAHGEAIPHQLALDLRETILGKRGQEGMLVWLAEHVEPKR